MHREQLRHGLALTASGPLRPPPLRLEAAGTARILLRQCGRPVLFARVDEDRGGVEISRRTGYESPLPPLRADEHRPGPNWLHRFADQLIAAGNGPLHSGRALLEYHPRLTPFTWTNEFLREWPGGYLDWIAGRTAIVPLRPLSSDNAPRVRAYRRRIREGRSAPVLLWWVSAFDGWLLLDGHDRAVAALAEGREPEAIVLARGLSRSRQTEWLSLITDHQREILTRHDDEAVRRTFEQQLATAREQFPYDRARTLAWPLTGGERAWDAAADMTTGNGVE